MFTDAHRRLDVRTTRLTDGHQFRKQPSPGDVLQPWFQNDQWKCPFRSEKHNMDKCVHTQDGQTDEHQFQKQPSPGGVL